MKLTPFRILLSSISATCLIIVSSQSANAGSLYNGWTYSIDSFRDGTEGGTIGDESEFEFYGLAVKETTDRVFFAINSNLPLTGYPSSFARNGRISYSDLFINFADLASFNHANGNLFAIRFDATNDTELPLGLYGQVTATSLTTVNNGYSSLQNYTTKIADLQGTVSYGDLPADTSYFDLNQAGYTAIASGNYLGSVTDVTSELPLLGLDFNALGARGTQTFGFSVDRALLPDGAFIANLFAECTNDGVAVSSALTRADDSTTVPEPSVLIGVVATGGVLVRSRRRAMVL